LLPTVREALSQLEATTQRSPRFDPAESDREFSIAASDYAVSILADPLLRLVKQADLAIKEKALARTAPLDAQAGRYQPPDALVAFLESL
jgi:DNA-binding transcriptional LysR family regulator